MKKKGLALCMALILSVSLSACGDKGEAASSGTGTLTTIEATVSAGSTESTKETEATKGTKESETASSETKETPQTQSQAGTQVKVETKTPATKDKDKSPTTSSGSKEADKTTPSSTAPSKGTDSTKPGSGSNTGTKPTQTPPSTGSGTGNGGTGSGGTGNGGTGSGGTGSGGTGNGGTGNGGTSTPTPPPAHTSCTWDAGSVTANPTCNAEGVKTYTCTVCKKTKTESIAKTAHSYKTETTAATCTAGGKEKVVCSICGSVQSEKDTAALGHDMKQQWWYEPTCTKGGYYNDNCTRCNYSIPVSLDPLPHNVVDTEIQHGNCITFTIITHVCSTCGNKIGSDTEYLEENDHDWVTDEEGTYCSRCTTGQ